MKKRDGGASWVARCRFRDFDGVTRSLEYAGRSKTAAAAALQDALQDRMGSPKAPLRPQHTFERASEMWLSKLDAQVAEGTRAATTADTYRQRLRSVILPAMGQWRIHECTVPQLDGFFRGLTATQSPESRKTIRTVVSLILRLAVQHEAIRDNPVRHLDPIESASRKRVLQQALEAARLAAAQVHRDTRFRFDPDRRDPAQMQLLATLAAIRAADNTVSSLREPLQIFTTETASLVVEDERAGAARDVPRTARAWRGHVELRRRPRRDLAQPRD